MCHVLSVSTSGYYDWLSRPLSQRAVDRRRLVTKLKVFHAASFETYGSPRLHEDLINDGEQCSPRTVARVMQQHNIQAKTARRFVITTHSKNTLAPAPNLLARRFTVATPNTAWVSDTTFIRTRRGWLYLAIILDLYSRLIIGWSMNQRNHAQLVCDAFAMAVSRRYITPGLILHSDQGSTYASGEYQRQLNRHQVRCSMSRKGECLDNAVAESFFASLKTEWVDDFDYLNHDQARQSIFEYVELFYNRRRRHSYLNYQSPVDFEASNGF